MNCVLCYLLKTTVQQHRLPPDHSHTWHTDGMFAAIEGWLTHAGFKGCNTVSEMVVFLQTMFARSDAYKHQKVCFRFPPPSSLLPNLRQKSARSLPDERSPTHLLFFVQVEINVLIANFAFTKWVLKHVDSPDALKGIKTPLVWKHFWCPTAKKVISQYK